LRFEEAARLYKRLQAVEETVGKQRVTSVKQRDQDIFGYYRTGDTVQLQTLNVRSGQLVGGRSYTFTQQLGADEEVLSSFINQYYADNPYIPREVLLPCVLEDAEALAELLSEQKGRQVFLEVPQRGDKHHLVQLAMKNAALFIAGGWRQGTTADGVAGARRTRHHRSRSGRHRQESAQRGPPDRRPAA
jgi:excinuclease ABC subunit C